jgi:hypothetical protein
MDLPRSDTCEREARNVIEDILRLQANIARRAPPATDTRDQREASFRNTVRYSLMKRSTRTPLA